MTQACTTAPTLRNTVHARTHSRHRHIPINTKLSTQPNPRLSYISRVPDQMELRDVQTDSGTLLMLRIKNKKSCIVNVRSTFSVLVQFVSLHGDVNN